MELYIYEGKRTRTGLQKNGGVTLIEKGEHVCTGKKRRRALGAKSKRNRGKGRVERGEQGEEIKEGDCKRDMKKGQRKK